METFEINVVEMMQFALDVRLCHWMTTDYAKHVALGEFYDSLNGSIDTFAEACMGMTGRRFSTESIFTGLTMNNVTDSNFILFRMRQIQQSLTSMVKQYADHLELQNILIDLVGDADKLCYLLTLA